jgi:hypothetical protein
MGVAVPDPSCFSVSSTLHWRRRVRVGFTAQMFTRRTELSVTTKLSVEHETPYIANVLV